jgi:hypothetical protein
MSYKDLRPQTVEDESDFESLMLKPWFCCHLSTSIPVLVLLFWGPQPAALRAVQRIMSPPSARPLAANAGRQPI